MHKLLLTLPLIALLTVWSCRDDDGEAAPTRYVPTEADYARCAHIDRDAELGGYVYDLCLVNPWPTELPEIEVGGEHVLGAWINDTLAFVAYNPRESAGFNIKFTRYENEGFTTISGQRSTYSDIEESYFSLLIAIDNQGQICDGKTSSLWITEHPLEGEYIVDPSISSTSFSQKDGYGFGTFDLILLDSTTNRTITLSDGRFHAYYGE